MIGRRKQSPWYRVLTYGLEYLGRFYASYPGYVLDVRDPENRNRIRVGVPSVDGQFVDPTWAEPLGQWGGKGYGVNLMPIQGDLVWVSYRHGDPKYPLWTYGSFGKGYKPEEFSSSRVYGLKTPKGHIVIINDDEDSLQIIHKEKGLITLNIDKLKLNHTDLIELGDSNLEPAVKGDKTADHINNILQGIAAITVTVGGTPVPINNIVTFTNLIGQTDTIKSNKVKLE